MKKIKNDIRDNVVYLAKKGVSNVKNSKVNDISEMSIRRILKERNVNVKKNYGGRPKKLSNGEERYLLKKFNSMEATNSSSGAKIIQEATNKKVSKSTIKRTLYKHGYQSYKRKKAPLLTKKHINARKRYYEAHKGKSFDEFNNFIFTDESSYHLLGVKGGLTYYKKKSSKSNANSFIRTKKFGGGSLMIWGFIASNGTFKIYKCPPKMNSKSYIKLLEDGPLNDIANCGHKLSEIVFMQDNASCHNSEMTKKWFKDSNITLLDWPPQSPDMNPIENLWDYLDRRVRLRQEKILTLDDLWNILLDEASKIDKNYVIRLYQSIPRRINALKDANYNATKY